MINIDVRVDTKKIMNDAARELSTQSRQIALRILKALEAATPVDTGRARNSWRVIVMNEERFLLNNSTKYIRYLNAGSSQQATAHFIERIALSYGIPKGAVVEYL